MAGDVADHLTAAGGMPDVHGIAEIEVGDHRGEVVGVVVHVMTGVGLGGASVPPSVGGDHPVAMQQEEHHLGVPVIG